MPEHRFTDEQVTAAALVAIPDHGTLAAYLVELLDTLWVEEEGFSGKRPFGNGGWQFDVFAALLRAGLVKGSLDEQGYVKDIDRKEADALVRAVIARFAVA